MVTRAAVATAVGLLMAAGVAGAMPSWTAPRVISDAFVGGLALEPELAANASGADVVVWHRETGPDCVEAPASLTCIHTVETAYRVDPGGPWNSPNAINRPGWVQGRARRSTTPATRC